MTEVKPRSRIARLGLEALGWLLMAAGLAAIVLPGPGLVLLAAGLYVLSLEYAWAQRLLDPVKRAAEKSAADSVKTWPRIIFSSVLALGISAVGVVWGLRPHAPSWWPIDDKWWLVGGWGTGVVLIASGIVAFGMIVWSVKSFRFGHETMSDVFHDLHVDDD
jgi:hypothetical protein